MYIYFIYNFIRMVCFSLIHPSLQDIQGYTRFVTGARLVFTYCHHFLLLPAAIFFPSLSFVCCCVLFLCSCFFIKNFYQLSLFRSLLLIHFVCFTLFLVFCLKLYKLFDIYIYVCVYTVFIYILLFLFFFKFIVLYFITS